MFSINATGTILFIDLLSGHTLSDVYVLAGYGELEGTFEEVYFNGMLVQNPTAEGSFGGGYRLSYNEHQLVLIPEPKPMVLLVAALGAIGLLAGGKRTTARGMG